MCGITGYIQSTSLDDADHQRVADINEALAHRGPNSAGHYTDEHVSLAMRRLSIIDVGGGQQPIYNEDRSIVIICNGEIYNYVELRDMLEQRGHVFSTHSDVETIVHLYEEYGVDAVNHLRGMFAFALWDSHRQELYIVRDRVGEKPLYIYQTDYSVLFASEFKALFASEIVPFEVNAEAVHQFFHYGFVIEPQTLNRHVQKLRAGHFMRITPHDWSVDVQQYWSLDNAPPLEGDPVQAIRDELDEIGKIIIRSDVPIGVALSGGIDSSVIAMLAAKHSPDTIAAFSVGYEGRPPYDERDQAHTYAKQLRMPFYDIEIQPNDIVELFPELVRWTDDPIADPASLSYYSIMKHARDNGVPVMLQGQGGDELFWGYPWLTHALHDSHVKRAIATGEIVGYQRLRTALSYIVPPIDDGFALGSVKSWLGSMRRGTYKGHIRWDAIVNHPDDALVMWDIVDSYILAKSELVNIYTSSFYQQTTAYRMDSPFQVGDDWNCLPVKMTQFIFDTYLRENGITQGDRLSMASSVELRLPFVDYRLAEIVVGHRKTQDDSGLSPKHWLKQAIKGLIPDEILNRPKKGFQPPVFAWYRALVDVFGEKLRDGWLVQQEVIQAEAVNRLLSDLTPQNLNLLYKLLILELWFRQYVTVSKSYAV